MIILRPLCTEGFSCVLYLWVSKLFYPATSKLNNQIPNLCIFKVTRLSIWEADWFMEASKPRKSCFKIQTQLQFLTGISWPAHHFSRSTSNPQGKTMFSTLEVRVWVSLASKPFWRECFVKSGFHRLHVNVERSALETSKSEEIPSQES